MEPGVELPGHVKTKQSSGLSLSLPFILLQDQHALSDSIHLLSRHQPYRACKNHSCPF